MYSILSNFHLFLTNWLGSLGGLGGLCSFGGTGLGNLGSLGGLDIRLAAALLSMKGLRLENVGFAGWTAAANAGRVASYPTFACRQPSNLTV